MTIQYKAVMTCISANATPGVNGTHDVVIGGKRKADGPSYLTETVQDLLSTPEGHEVLDFRLSVLSIDTHGHFFRYVCQSIVRINEDGVPANYRDTIHVYIDRRTIEEIPAEE